MLDGLRPHDRTIATVGAVLGEDQGMTAQLGTLVGPVAIVGGGRLGSVLAAALAAAGVTVTGPHGRGFTGRDASIVVLCVPDAAIAGAARMIVDGPLVAHCSGATSLAALSPHRGFSLHPVMTFTDGTRPAALHGTGAAVSGTDAGALAIARELAGRIGLVPFEVAEDDRVAYHAATAMAANFLITLEAAAAVLAETARVDPHVLLPLARAALENWGRRGIDALTGPIARGDHAVVAAHRVAISDRAAQLLPMFDALAAATAELAGHRTFAGEPA